MSDANNPAFPPNHDPNTHEFGLTKRQYAAIKLKVPDSGEEWLDDMIRQSLRDDFAAKAMQGWISAQPKIGNEPLNGTSEMGSQLAVVAYIYADSMIQKRSKA